MKYSLIYGEKLLLSCLSISCWCLQATFFRKAIEDMAARTLRCVAIAYRTCDSENVPTDEEELSNWALPEDNLVLLAIVGIKVYLYVLESQCLMMFCT